MRSKTANNKVFVGLSGGVDSSVSAALLKKEGYDVTGVFIKVWQPEWISCTWKEERREAMRAAAHLDIPFITLDLEQEYKRDVIDYMIREYKEGRTPNPDVMCNRYVKFGAFWKWAKANGADFIATGHYARIEAVANAPAGLPGKTKILAETETMYSLLAGKDGNKDQSYFLWTLNQGDLEHVLFPIGNLTKDEVRKLARKYGLPNAEKKDSQGLCFIGKVDVKEFLSRYIDPKPGIVMNERGVEIGRHPGALLFTIGERHGFTISEKSPHDDKYYVTGKDVDKNVLIVSHKDTDRFLPGARRDVTISNIGWVEGVLPNSRARNLRARTRYRQPLQKISRIEDAAKNGALIVSFDQPQDTLTPGQSLVIYEGEICLGGGVIM